MAISGSGLYYTTFRDILGTAQLAVDLDSETTNKLALYNNTITPNFATDTAQSAAPYTSGECTGGSWGAGGVVLTTTAIDTSGTVLLRWKCADVSVATTTISAARGALIYGLATTTKNAVCLIDFGADYSTSNGTFAITWTSSVVWTVDLTP